MKDRRDNPVGTWSAAALDHAETALWRMASFFDAPIADIDAAIAQDPQWMLPHVMRAAFLLTLTEPSLVGDAKAALRHADKLAAHATDRERAHLAAAHRCARGDWHGACIAWSAILDEHPRDLYALQWAHLFDFYRGDATQLRRRPERVLPAWSLDDALRPYVLGMHAFGLEECGAYRQAEAVGLEAVAGPAKVPWATHAVAHVMEMQGRCEQGLAWLRARQSDWADGNGFAGHHWWHLALFHLESLDVPGALAIYDAHLGGNNAALTLHRLDGAALLWRIHLLGADVGARWDDIASGWDWSPEAVGHSAFNDVHGLLIRLGQQRWAQADSLIEAAQKRSDSADDSNADMTRDIGLPLMHGLRAFSTDCFNDALALISPVRAIAHRFGGSHAQRDLITQTLLACAAGARDVSTAAKLLSARPQSAVHTPLTVHWMDRVNS